ncbi:MAG: MarR family transcriptional regulator [Hyphomicrobiales bacterium]|nr:MAG: MarR family transcriptional regulator [Hyphomicrobiales bacterium]
MQLTREKYRLIQYHFVQFFAEHLSDASKAFDGDLQEMLVLAVIGQVALQADGQGRGNASISASRLSDVTGVPRQTVRRKLESLKDRGWIEKVEDAGWRLLVEQDQAAPAQIDLLELDARGMERIIKLVRTLGPYV